MIDHKHKKILVVEDDKPLYLSLKDNLIQEGFDVVLAKNGEEGLAAALREKPDLILLDLLMPVMDGLTMLSRLRDDPWGAKVPVIILSNLSDSAAVAKAIEGGTYGYLVKTDWKIEEVVAKIRDRLGI